MHRRPTTVRALLALCSLAAVTAGTGALAAAEPRADEATPARTVPFDLVVDRDVDDRLPRPEDRYAMAGGCYTLEAPGQGFVSRTDAGLVLTGDRAAALPLHFQPTRLGEYLLATDEGPDTRYDGAWWDVRGEGTVRGAKGGFAFSVPSREQVLVVSGASLQLAPADSNEPTSLELRHVRPNDPTAGDCAVWPEIETGASGKPEPVAESEASRARGFFEAHVHGMAYEFLGGELRCGQPWHPYGVEYALGDCYEQGNVYNSVLEVGLAGQSPTDPVAEYDPVGWPTFEYWPQQDTLTHEQFYWRWLERAHAGGLRLLTNLLVDNTALCQAFPAKKNSCNEMDGVRLQAQRMFEFQDYIDAQAGGPGEGWLRIVTDPVQARQTINAGRLAVVLGIEISELFDCREVLDQPQCTEAQIDERLQEVFDMGVRQMELINKFDNALAGVTGDGGSTGVIVNAGNRYVTGHFWDMRGCEPEGHAHEHGIEGDEHDKTQPSVTDASPGDGEGIDALAGRVLDEFGGVTKGFVAPAYGPGPHCNSRGLTDLGRYLITAMVAKGMIFDPDHMSASAQREALDLIEDGIWPAEQQAARDQDRPAVKPAVISSHSWGNDVIYQRIYGADGVVAPRTDNAAGFVDRWRQNRTFAADNAPDGYDFGMGYGADTNGLGGQPGPRGEAATRVDYTEGFDAPIGDVRLEQLTSGLRTFDINTEGVSQYGMFADWFHELTLAADERAADLGGGEAIVDDMLDGAETYLSLWERAVFGGGDCVTDGSTLQFEDIHAALGLNLEGFLTAIGQPVDRDGAAYVYCVEGEDDGQPAVVEVLFDEGGTATDVAPSDRTAATASPQPPAVSAAGTAGAAGVAAASASAPGAAATSSGHDHTSGDQAHDDDDVVAR